MAIIKTEHLVYTYNTGTPQQKVAVDDVNLEIEQGEFVGVIGHTGSGKSTLIQHLNGLLAPSSGKVYVDGEDIWADKSKLRQVRFKVGLVFQYPEYQLFEETVAKDIAFPRIRPPPPIWNPLKRTASCSRPEAATLSRCVPPSWNALTLSLIHI